MLNYRWPFKDFQHRFKEEEKGQTFIEYQELWLISSQMAPGIKRITLK